MRRPAFLFCTAILALTGGGAEARQRAVDAGHADAQPGLSAATAADPLARVFIVTAQATFDRGIGTFARQPAARRDGAGRALVIAEIAANRLDDVSQIVHEQEKRCGGYFAFDTRAQAEAFVRADRTAQGMVAPFAASYTIDSQATVLPWLPEVSAASLLATIEHLSESYPNRRFDTTSGRASAEWIRTRWAGLAGNRADVTTELFTACGNCGIQPSVILTIAGRERADEIVVLGAHLDSTSSTGSGENRDAPGADDDASGIATLTEVLRIAMADGWRPQRTIKFMGYAAEEVGLRGSRAIATSFRASNRNVVGVLQLDMTNYRTGGVDLNIVTDFSNADLTTYFGQLFDTYLAPLGLTRGSYTCGYGCSDHASWTSSAYPSGMVFESTLLPTIHTPDDTLAYVGNSVASTVNFAKFGLAFLGEMGKTSATVDPNVRPRASFTATVSGNVATFNNQSSDSDGSIVSQRWDFGDGTTSTAFAPSKTFARAGVHGVTLTVVDDRGGVATHIRIVKTRAP